MERHVLAVIVLAILAISGCAEATSVQCGQYDLRNDYSPTMEATATCLRRAIQHGEPAQAELLDVNWIEGGGIAAVLTVVLGTATVEYPNGEFGNETCEALSIERSSGGELVVIFRGCFGYSGSEPAGTRWP